MGLWLYGFIIRWPRWSCAAVTRGPSGGAVAVTASSTSADIFRRGRQASAALPGRMFQDRYDRRLAAL